MKKVLVCDDDESILDVIKIVLEKNRYKVKTVSSAKKILETIKKYSPNLILLDITMPMLDAVKTIKLIKEKFDRIPIILVSAVDKLEKRGKSLRVSDFIDKPFDMNDLLQKVKQHIK